MNDLHVVADHADAKRRAKAAKALIANGHPGQAAAILDALTKACPEQFWPWAVLAECHEKLGDADSELRALQRAIALNPGRERIRGRIASLLIARGDLSGAADQYGRLSEANPTVLKFALRRAQLCERLDRPEQEAKAWTGVLALAPDCGRAHHRLSVLHWNAGRRRQTVPHLQWLLAADPAKTKLWRRLGHALEEAGDLEGAWAVWSRLFEQDPHDPEAAERLARLRITRVGAARDATASVPAARLMVLGNCQAYAMARCLRALNPELEVTAVSWAELTSDDQVQRVAAALERVDALISQPNPEPWFGCLTTRSRVSGDTRALLIPAVHFTGFHPDAVVMRQRHVLPSLIGGWHSALIMAGYRLGLPAERTAELFNAYIYGVLGYFDESAKAEQFLLQRSLKLGWDLASDLEEWRRGGAFIHTPNHPRITVMMSLARRVCARLGLEIDTAASLPPDPFDQTGDWPIYPEVAKRLGIAGELVFVSPEDRERPLELAGAIDWYYRVYTQAPPERLSVQRVEDVACVLKAEGV